MDEGAFRKLCKLIFVDYTNNWCIASENPGALTGLLKPVLKRLEKIGEVNGIATTKIFKEMELLDGVPRKFVKSPHGNYFSYRGTEPTHVFCDRLELRCESCREQYEKYEAFSKAELKKEQEQKEKENITKTQTPTLTQTTEYSELLPDCTGDCGEIDETETKVRTFGCTGDCGVKPEEKNGGPDCRKPIDSTEESDGFTTPKEEKPEIKPIENEMTIDKISKKAEWLLETLINGKNVNEKVVVDCICEEIMMVPNLSGELKNEYCNCFRKALEKPNALETIIIYLTGLLFFLKGKFKEGQLCFDNPKKAKKKFGLEDGLNKIKANDRKPKFNLTENRNEIRILE